jgi:hypothetical protein
MKQVKKVWEWLDGKKTFIGSLVIFIAGGLKALGKIDENTFNWLVALGGAISVYGIRDAIKKLE